MPDVTQHSLPDPLTPPSCDLRGLEDMPINVQWMRDMPVAANATGDEFRAAILLMFASWHQCPSGSLPNDDQQLVFLAGCGRRVKGFLKIKERALSGWILCSDNRWYHPVIAKVVLRAWSQKQDSDARKGKRAKSARAAANARWSPSLIARDTGRESDLAPDDVEPAKAGVGTEPVSYADRMHGALVLHGGHDHEVPVSPEAVAAVEDADGNGKRRKKGQVSSISSKKDLRAALLDVELPEWLPKNLWEQYVDFRFEIRKPLTLKARDMAIRTLEKLRHEGNDPTDVIEASMVSGWTGLFPVKKGKGPARHRAETGSLFDSGGEQHAPFSVVTRL
jgi:hypothetical protein